MIRLRKTLSAWGRSDFNSVCKKEIEKIPVETLPLYQAMQQGNFVRDDYLKIMIITSGSSTSSITIKAGVFFISQLTGCSCNNDPTPNAEYNEYCEMIFNINKENAETNVSIIS